MATQGLTKDIVLRTISASKVLDGNPSIKDDLLSACQEQGFFYLDYRGTILEEVSELYCVAQEFFDLSLEEKMEYDVETQGPEKYDGYKIAGRSTGPFAEKRDGFEAFTTPNNSLFNTISGMAFRGPPCVQRNRATIQRCIMHMNKLSLQILDLLSSALLWPASQALGLSHRGDKPSTSALSLLRYLPDSPGTDKAGHMAHTDIGTLAIVFSEVPGLQVQLPGQAEWQFIPPKRGHAIVNVGDCLTFLTHGRLPSILHRVVPVPEPSGIKFSLGYFLRPEFEAKLTDRDGMVWKSHDWHCNKFKVFRASLDEQRKGSYLTGKAGYLGLVEEKGGPNVVLSEQHNSHANSEEKM